MLSSNYLQIFRQKKQSTILLKSFIEQIFVHKKLTPICSKLIFRKLLIKLATKYTFKSRFPKQINGCAIYNLPHELQSNLRLRILGNKEILEKFQNFIELLPCAQSFSRNENFVNTTTSHKIFQTNSSFDVKQRTTRKVQFLLVSSFLLILTKFSFWEEDWHQATIL